MCGRYTLIGPARIRSAFPQYHFEEFSEYRLPRFNVAPAQDVLGVCNDGTNEVRALHWGMAGRINVRGETLVAHRTPWRCIIFADGFYEWRSRKPYYYTLADNALFAFAGVYEPAMGCAIVTVDANALVAAVHDRMPAILRDDEQPAWLKPGDIERELADELLRPFPADEMRVRTASMRLNAARYDAPDVLIDDDPVQTSMFESDR